MSMESARLADEELPFAQLEDQWEMLVRNLLREEGLGNSPDTYAKVEKKGELESHDGGGNSNLGGDRKGESYSDSVWVAMQDISRKLNEERVENIAKAKAMMEIIEEEQRYAKIENKSKPA
jgi:hypothetical protein